MPDKDLEAVNHNPIAALFHDTTCAEPLEDPDFHYEHAYTYVAGTEHSDLGDGSGLAPSCQVRAAIVLASLRSNPALALAVAEELVRGTGVALVRFADHAEDTPYDKSEVFPVEDLPVGSGLG